MIEGRLAVMRFNFTSKYHRNVAQILMLMNREYRHIRDYRVREILEIKIFRSHELNVRENEVYLDFYRQILINDIFLSYQSAVVSTI
jgi:hypothetical protein